MNTYFVDFEENAGEYTGILVVECEKIKIITERIVVADNVKIIFDEDILKVYNEDDKTIWKWNEASV